MISVWTKEILYDSPLNWFVNYVLVRTIVLHPKVNIFIMNNRGSKCLIQITRHAHDRLDSQVELQAGEPEVRAEGRMSLWSARFQLNSNHVQAEPRDTFVDFTGLTSVMQQKSSYLDHMSWSNLIIVNWMNFDAKHLRLTFFFIFKVSNLWDIPDSTDDIRTDKDFWLNQ